MSVKKLTACIDGHAGASWSGRLYDRDEGSHGPFRDLNAMSLMAEAACEASRSPFPSVKRRHFAGGSGAEKEVPGMADAMTRYDGMIPDGELGTFDVRVQHRRNGTWQGRVTWMEENLTMEFRSTWELVQLMDEACRRGAPPEASWADAKKA